MIGVFGGTFDPVHYGHLRAAQEAFAQLKLAELRFTPAFAPPLRAAPVASAAQRLAMLELAIRGLPGLVADDREIRRGGVSYTVLTLEELRRECGAAPLCLLIGMDQFLGFENWHRWREIPELAHIVVLSRPGVVPDRLPDWAQPRRTGDLATLGTRPSGCLAFLAVSPQDISATRIRERLARGLPVAGLVPEAVQDYIRVNQVYGQHDRGE